MSQRHQTTPPPIFDGSPLENSEVNSGKRNHSHASTDKNKNLKQLTSSMSKRDPDQLRATKLRKVAKDLGIVSARLGRTRSETRKQCHLSKIQSVARSRHRRSLLKHVTLRKTENQYLSQVFGSQKDYVFDFKPLRSEYQCVSDFSESIDSYTLIEQLRRLFLKHSLRSGEGIYFRVVVYGSDYEPGTNEHEVFSTKHFPRFADLLCAVEHKINEMTLQYGVGEKDIKQVVISELFTNLASAAASSSRRAEMHNSYIIPTEYKTTTNCAYTGIAICRDPVSFVADYVKQLQAQVENSDAKIDFTKWAQKARDIKNELHRKALDIKKGFASTDDLQTYVDAQVKDKRDLIIRDAQFKIVERMQAPKSNDSNPRRKAKQLGPPLELQRVNNHIRPLIPRCLLPAELIEAHDAAQKGLQTKPVEDPVAKKIAKDFVKNARDHNDERIMTADIETSNKTVTQEELQKGVKTMTYAAGCAWYRDVFVREKEPLGCTSYWDGDREILYKAWWGADALVQYMLFLDSNQEYFNKTTIYFHNGGKFDLHQLIRDCLFDYWGFKILTDRCIMSNGRWINFGIEGEDNESVMTFKDSFAMIPSGLSKMAKDYKVPHYKKDDVDHDTITIDNWQEQKDKLEVYLRHDCLSLLEVLKRHGDVVFNETYCEKCELNKDEYHTLNVLEALVIGSKFTKRRDLSWLKCPRNPKVKLELDGYDENLGIAVEVQSPEHYTFNKFFHKDEDGFKLQQERDQAKVDACKKKGVHLILIPYTQCLNQKRLVSFLKGELRKTDFALNESPITNEEYEADRILHSGHLTMTQCMTASGLSKKWFYHSFYDKKKYPIFTLTPEQDAFIRDQSYLGGRVELFRFGHINDKVYYLDFTSLYPAMMVKDLPYGEPYEAVFEETVLPDNFFGFVRCKVKSTEEGLQRLPLHGEKMDGKLKFRHLVKWQELVLFSEEIREGIKQGIYEYKFIDGVGFKRGKHLKPMVEKLFEMKAAAKREGKDALSSVLKIVLNSLYGFWGTRTADREGLEIYLNDGDVPFFDHLEKQQLVDITEHERYTVLRVEKDLPIDDINVSIAAATTSYARVRIWRLMDAIKRRGGEVYMCDTDSVITNCDLSLHPNLMAEYIPDYQGNDPGAALGSLKCECTDDVKKALKTAKYTPEQIKDTLNEMRGGGIAKVPWKPIPFDQCILSVLKTYALRKELPTGNIFTFKHKGVSKALSSGLSEEQEEALWQTYLDMHLKQTPLRYERNLQFRAGLGSYMHKSGLVPLMKFEVSKDVLAQYDKGSFETENYVEGVKAIVPLTNLMDKDNQCFNAPKCRLQFVLHLQAAFPAVPPSVSLREPINTTRLAEVIGYIENQMHILQPKGQNRAHDKVREVHSWLCSLRDNPPERVEYRYATGIGRLYVSGGTKNMRSKTMQDCYKGLRPALIGHKGHDIDIENSLPSLTLQWLDMFGERSAQLPLDSLRNYVNHREKWFEEISEWHGCDRDTAKRLVLITLFGGEPSWKLKVERNSDVLYPKLQQFVTDLAVVRRNVVTWQNEIPKYKELYNQKLKQKRGDVAATERSMFSLYTHEVEDVVMGYLRDFMSLQNIEIFALIFDGMITNACSDALLRAAEAYVEDQTGLHIKLAEKPLFGLQNQPIPELACLM